MYCAAGEAWGGGFERVDWDTTAVMTVSLCADIKYAAVQSIESRRNDEEINDTKTK